MSAVKRQSNPELAPDVFLVDVFAAVAFHALMNGRKDYEFAQGWRTGAQTAETAYRVAGDMLVERKKHLPYHSTPRERALRQGNKP